MLTDDKSKNLSNENKEINVLINPTRVGIRFFSGPSDSNLLPVETKNKKIKTENKENENKHEKDKENGNMVVRYHINFNLHVSFNNVIY